MLKYSLISLLLVAQLIFGSMQAFAGPKASSRWGANYFPNVPLVTHEGKSVRFFDDLIKDKVVVINFIYTTCPDSCPLETARLREVQAILGDRVGSDIFIYSITIDPERDTPKVLKEYSEMYQTGPGWLFLTGDEADIIQLRKKLGLYIEEIQDGSNDHNLSLIIGNQATGRWMKRSPFENPYVLATQIGSWLHNWKKPNRDMKSYANAPALRQHLSKGETLYRTRCSACHTIGGGDIMKPDEGKVGPDLLGVLDKRPRLWIERWLAEPDKMLEEKDPLALRLFAKYRNVPMPNMKLNQLEVDNLIEYIDKESCRVEKAQQEKVTASAKGLAGTKPCCMPMKQKTEGSSG